MEATTRILILSAKTPGVKVKSLDQHNKPLVLLRSIICENRRLVSL